VCGVGAALALWRLVDPVLPIPSILGPLLAAVGVLESSPGPRRRVGGFLALLAFAYCTADFVRPDLGGDSKSYLMHLRSAVFDHDLRFEHDLALWGYVDVPSDSWISKNVHPIGPALLWSPAYLLAHGYVLLNRALGRNVWAADGIDVPYIRAVAAMTVTWVLVGLAALFSLLRRRVDSSVAGLAVAAAWTSSTIAFYTFAEPAMAHGLVFACAALVLWASERAWRVGTAWSWMATGVLLGALVLCRWQAAVFGLVPLLVALAALRAGKLSSRVALLSGGAALAITFLQLCAWKVQHGAWLTLPQGSGYVDWASPRLLDVLLSADRGLLVWTPLVALGLLVLPLAARRWGHAVVTAALVVVALTAWVNGGVRDFSGGDAFGARRFDLVVPFAAFGLAELLVSARAFVSRRPLAAPALVLVFACFWNLGLMRLFRQRIVTRAAPLEATTAAQAAQVREGAESLAARWGRRARHVVYGALVGEYIYETVPGGDLALDTERPRFLGRGFSPVRVREGDPPFRWAAYPEACWVLPVGTPLELRLQVTARTPRRLSDQTVTLVVNGTPLGTQALGSSWTVLAVPVPAQALHAGPNDVCLRFSRAMAGEEGAEVAAAISKAELP
jgi:hypothetical protein